MRYRYVIHQLEMNLVVQHQSPILRMEEYTAKPSPMRAAYCHLLTEEQFETTGMTETEKAVKALIEHLENNPTQYLQVMRKRKLDEIETSGMVSFLKSKVMSTIMGDKYRESLVTEEECRARLEEMTSGMMVVHHYAKETKRCSKRLAEKSECQTPSGHSSSLARPSLHSVSDLLCSASVRLPPPPPPCPPPPPPVLPLPVCLVFPLKEKNTFVSSTPVNGQFKAPAAGLLKRHSSSASLAAISQELKSSDPMKRLKTTQIARSPGGTPMSKTIGAGDQINGSLQWISPFNSSEPLSRAFQRIMQNKFKNTRSPCSTSSADTSPAVNSPGAFSP